MPVVLLIHDMPQVFEIADRVHIHRRGQRVAVLRPEEWTKSEAVAIMTRAIDAEGHAALGGRATVLSSLGSGPLAGRVRNELELCLREHTGTPEMFDVFGYLALLRWLRDRDEEVVYAPRLDRALEEPIGRAIAVPRDVPLVVTEGNYLLLGSGACAGSRPLLDES